MNSRLLTAVVPSRGFPVADRTIAEFLLPLKSRTRTLALPPGSEVLSVTALGSDARLAVLHDPGDGRPREPRHFEVRKAGEPFPAGRSEELSAEGSRAFLGSVRYLGTVLHLFEFVPSGPSGPAAT